MGMGATRAEREAVDDVEFRRLFERYHRPLLAFFRRRGFCLEEAREMTQETFLAAYRTYGRFRGESERGTWLFGIAKNMWRRRVRDQGRGKRRARLVPLEEARGNPPVLPTGRGQAPADPLSQTLAAERVQRMRRALEELPEPMRQCLVLRIDQELSYRQIAAVLRMTVNDVKSHLYQARQKLKCLLSGRDEPVSERMDVP